MWAVGMGVKGVGGWVWSKQSRKSSAVAVSFELSLKLSILPLSQCFHQRVLAFPFGPEDVPISAKTILLSVCLHD